MKSFPRGLGRHTLLAGFTSLAAALALASCGSYQAECSQEEQIRHTYGTADTSDDPQWLADEVERLVGTNSSDGIATSGDVLRAAARAEILSRNPGVLGAADGTEYHSPERCVWASQ